DDRRRGRHRPAARPALRDARAGSGHPRSHARPGAPRGHGRAGLPPLRSERRRPLREDVHNGIEYGLMAAYSEGLNILRHANVGKRTRTTDAETTPLRDPVYYQYDLDLADIAEVWRRGSVVASWLLDLTAAALASDPRLE